MNQQEWIYFFELWHSEIGRRASLENLIDLAKKHDMFKYIRSQSNRSRRNYLFRSALLDKKGVLVGRFSLSVGKEVGSSSLFYEITLDDCHGPVV